MVLAKNHRVKLDLRSSSRPCQTASWRWGWPPSQSPFGEVRHHRQIVGRAGAWSDHPRWIWMGLVLSPSPSSETMAATDDFHVVVAVADER